MQADPTQEIVISLKSSCQQMQKNIHIIGKVLNVDKELDSQNLTKSITIDKQCILIHFRSNDLKLLRSCVSGFFRHMHLVACTINEFKGI